MTVKINDKEVELRFTFNAFIEYEKHFNEPLSFDNINIDRTLWFYYFVVLCSQKGWQTTAWLTKEEFDEWMNEKPSRITELSEFATRNLNLNDILASPEDKKK